MTDHGTGGDSPSTGRSSGPADSVAGQPARRESSRSSASSSGIRSAARSTGTIRNRHRRHLRRVGQEHALDASTFDFAQGTPAREGNTIEVLIDGSEALPRMAPTWRRRRPTCTSPAGSSRPSWRSAARRSLSSCGSCWPSWPRRSTCASCSGRARRSRRFGLPGAMSARWSERWRATRRSGPRSIRCTGATHCHHEKTIVIDDRIAYVGGIDLTLDGGDPVRHAESPRPRRHRLARRRGADRRAGRARRGGALPPALDGSHARGAPPAEAARAGRRRDGADDADACRRDVQGAAARATTRSSSPTSAPCARPSRSSTSRTSSSGRPRSSTSSPTS